jgi:4-hydroxybenzoate polyprenyltransferase
MDGYRPHFCSEIPSIIMHRIETIIARIEQSSVSIKQCIVLFAIFVGIRNFLEAYSDHNHLQRIFITHYYSTYIFLACCLILLFKAVTGQCVRTAAKIVLPGFVCLVVAPICDLLLSVGKGYDIRYLQPANLQDLALRYLSFFGKDAVTPGIRIEIGLVLAVILLYFSVKRRNFFWGLLGSLLVYTAVFLWGAAPFFLISISRSFGLSFQYSNQLMQNFFLAGSVLLLIAIMQRANPGYFAAVLRDMRLSRIVHYLLLFLIGLRLSPAGFPWLVDAGNLLRCILFMCGIIGTCIAVLCIDNIEDKDIDGISNKDRPLVTGLIPLHVYRQIPYWTGLVASFCALAVSFQAFFFLFLFFGNYFLYSKTALRYFSVPSKIFIAFNCLLMVVAGYHLGNGNLLDFPLPLMAYIIGVFFFSANVIDIKDYEGDKIAGIKTLAVVAGLRNAKLVTGIAVIVSYALLPVIMHRFDFFAPALAAGTIGFAMVIRRKYDERFVFVPYLLSLAALICFL